jgi:hypothetical protein
MTDHEKELNDMRVKDFLKRAEVLKEIQVPLYALTNVTEEIKSIFTQRVEGYMEMSPEQNVYDQYIMSAETCGVERELHEFEFNKKLYGLTNLGLAPADIFFSNTIPVKHMVIQPKLYPTDKVIDSYELHVVDDETRLKNIQAVLNGDAKNATVMWMRHTAYTIKNGVKGWMRVYKKFNVEKDANYIGLNKTIYLETSESFKELFGVEVYRRSPVHSLNLLGEEEHQVMMEVYNAWYTLQQCILTKELSSYVKKTRTSMDFMKNKYVSSKNKKMINKYIIQLEKIQEAFIINSEETEDSGRKYRKPLWHVTGHWRHYKSGKRVFVQGYWKGSERNNDNIKTAPVEISIDNWLDILNVDNN